VKVVDDFLSPFLLNKIKKEVDLILSFRLLNVGGLLYLDDYFWGFNDKTIYESPKLGIDSFVSVYKDKLRVIDALKNNKSTCFVKVSE